jgi:hypothetical protein
MYVLGVAQFYSNSVHVITEVAFDVLTRRPLSLLLG